MRTEYKARYCLELSGCGGTAYDASFNSLVGKEYWKSKMFTQKTWHNHLKKTVLVNEKSLIKCRFNMKIGEFLKL